ncbi:cyclic nucleotide-binding domain-containing protein [Chlamydiales bacterium]|nr:cyclic nucleotide-binding domain-containing protein [Chlamydiales bacterium]
MKFFDRVFWFFNKRYIPQVVSCLKKTKLFSHFEKSKLIEICKTSHLRKIKKGNLIFKEGEYGNSCFVIIEGSVQVFTQNHLKEAIILARLEKNQYFGEQALLNKEGGQRNASIQTLTDVVLLEIDRKQFLNLVNSKDNLKEALRVIGKDQLLTRIISQNTLYASIQDELRSADSNDVIDYRQNEVIFQEGDLADYAFFLLSGIVSIHFANKPEKSEVKIHADHLFGELGILRNRTRAGTAVAIQNVKLIRIKADKFREIYARTPELHSFFGALHSAYQLPSYGTVDQFTGKFTTLDALCSRFQTENGDIVLASRVLEAPIFSIFRQEKERIEVKKLQTIYYKDDDDNSRELVMYKGSCLGCNCNGNWGDLEKVCSSILNNETFSKNQIDHFLLTGNLFYSERVDALKEDREAIVCRCMKVSRGVLEDQINAGVHQIKELTKKTGAASVCGGCQFNIFTLLGQASWKSVEIYKMKKESADVYSFQLKSIDLPLLNFQSGQYIVLQGLIENRWVERCYTLSSFDEDPKYYRITVKKETGGLFSEWLFAQENLEEINLRISCPQGDFCLDLSKVTPIICFVAGIGITPVMAFVDAMKKNENLRPIHIYYSSHSEDQCVFKQELEKAAESNPNIGLHMRFTNKEGRITHSEIVDIVTSMPNSDIYICGPSAYIKKITESVPEQFAKNIHSENFLYAGEKIV